MGKPATIIVGLALGLSSLSGCCTTHANRFGKLSGEWVVLGNQVEVGTADAPHNAEPLTVKLSADASNGCVTDSALHSRFGDTCLESEAESAATPSMTDELPVGPTPTPKEVRWYCDRRSVMRITLERCPNSNTFRVAQLAWSIRAGVQ